MKEFKGTPGPWIADGCDVWSDHDMVAFISGEDSSLDEDRANANLIAAAPELLAALQELFADYKQLADSGDAGFWEIEDTEVGKKSLAAIAKALGEGK